MKRFEAILSTTQVDLHGERMTKGALESAAAVLRSHYVQMGVEHDPRHPPIGRFTEAWVEELPEGYAVLKGAGDLFEPGDALPESIEKRIVERDYPPASVTILYDRTYNSDEDKADVEELAARVGGKSAAGDQEGPRSAQRPGYRCRGLCVRADCLWLLQADRC